MISLGASFAIRILLQCDDLRSPAMLAPGAAVPVRLDRSNLPTVITLPAI